MLEIKVDDLSPVALKPGDVLLVRAQRSISAREAHEIRERVRTYFPDNDVVVHDPSIEISQVGLEPGDRLIVRCDGELTWSQAKLIKLRLCQAFPDNEIAMISDHATVAVERAEKSDDVPTLREGNDHGQ